MAELYNLTGKTIDDFDSVVNCISVRHKELISSIAGVKSALRQNILGVFENNKALINRGDNCTKTIDTIAEESITAVNSFMHFNMTSFRDECGDMILGETSPTEKLYNNTKATLMYYLPAVFPHSNDLTDVIHKLADEFKQYKAHFYKSKVVFSTYIIKCDVNSAVANDITNNWGKIFDFHGNVLPIVGIEDTIRNTQCADAIDQAVEVTTQKLTNLIINPADYVHVRVQLGNDKCLKFEDATLKKLAILNDDDTELYPGGAIALRKCSELLDLKYDDGEKPHENIKILSLENAVEGTLSDIAIKCGIDLAGASSSLATGGGAGTTGDGI